MWSGSKQVEPSSGCGPPVEVAAFHAIVSEHDGLSHHGQGVAPCRRLPGIHIRPTQEAHMLLVKVARPPNGATFRETFGCDETTPKWVNESHAVEFKVFPAPLTQCMVLPHTEPDMLCRSLAKGPYPNSFSVSMVSSLRFQSPPLRNVPKKPPWTTIPSTPFQRVKIRWASNPLLRW